VATYLIAYGRVIDPAQGIDAEMDVLVADGVISEIGKELVPPEGAHVIDASGKIVAPGLVDMHVHLREPGNEAAETIATGALAAVRGGFTSIACMPNTNPPISTRAVAEFVHLQGERAALSHVYPTGCITKDSSGEELAEMGDLVRGGAVAFSDDGKWVKSASVMRRAFQYAGMFDRMLISHCEDPDLSCDGVMHEGSISTVLGLPGIPAAAEEVAVARDVLLAESTGGRLHVAHVSTRRSVDIIRWAKKRGVRVTAEATPHHLTLTHEAVRGYDTSCKMNPPLRDAEDVAALREGLADGTIDCVASDHAPHRMEDKELEFGPAPFGVIGLETSLGVMATELVATGRMDWSELIARMSTAPASILGISGGSLKPGGPADITVIDPDAAWVVEAARFASRGRSCPFEGRTLQGRAVMVLVGGEPKFDILSTPST